MNEARILSRSGYKVSVICPRLGAKKLHEEIDGIKVYRYPSPSEPGGVLGYLWEYAYSITAMFLVSLWVSIREGVDIVHTQNPPDILFLIGAFYKIFGKKFIFDHNDLTPELYLSRFQNKKTMLRILLWLEKMSCRAADLVISTGISYTELEKTRDGMKDDKIVMVRNSPNLDDIKKLAPAETADGTADCKMLGYVGYLGYQDGADLLMKSLYHLNHDLGRQDFHCIIIGDGEKLEEMKRTARETDIERFITFTGRLKWEEAMRRIASVDIGLEPNPSNPLNDKTITVKVFEYMALGKPVVAYDLPEQRSAIDGATLFAPANNELEFAARVARLMDDRELRKTMGNTGRTKMENELNWKQSADNLLRAYEKLNGSRSG
jgi:glycosyltransferase involved in cell wall biosynthesis